jgi:hypothetical protein
MEYIAALSIMDDSLTHPAARSNPNVVRGEAENKYKTAAIAGPEAGPGLTMGDEARPLAT